MKEYCKVEMLRHVAEMTAYLSGFAMSCFVEVYVPPGVSALVMVLFAISSAITVALYLDCSVSCLFVLIDIYRWRDHSTSSEMYWNDHLIQRWDASFLSLIIGKHISCLPTREMSCEQQRSCLSF